MTGDPMDFRPSPRTVHTFQVLAALGAVVVTAGFFLAPQRIWPDLLLGSFGLVCLGLAGVFFVALHYVTGASWSTAIRRIPEAMSAALPVGAIGLLVVLLARPSLYPWRGGLLVSAEGYLGFKEVWLSEPFFLARAVFYLALWLVFRTLLLRTSRRQDSTGTFAGTQRNIRLGTSFVVLFGISFWLASYDWVMSLEPEWYSTIFGVYNFAGLFESGLAAIAVFVVWLRRGALRHTVTREHLQDLSTLLFAFATFWMYIWFSQYMLIWYANLPEETAYFIRRVHGGWGLLFVLDVVLNWVVPFLVLLPHANKRNPSVLAGTAVVVLLGRALDLYLMILRPFAGARPVPGIWDLGILSAVVGVFGLTVLLALRQAPLVPIGDPYLQESLHYHA